ncbi:MAG: glycine cleavage system protein GcvH [Pirellulaceae bacterium]
MVTPDLLFSETHEWVRVETAGGGKIATVGITAFAVEQLTDLVYMELPEVGRKLAAGDEFGVVESVKAVSPLYSPVTGEVVDVNTKLPDHLETLGSDPYQAGWIIRVKISDEQPLSKLLDRQAYDRQCAAEG